jgi:hypothetical protein
MPVLGFGVRLDRPTSYQADSDVAVLKAACAHGIQASDVA